MRMKLNITTRDRTHKNTRTNGVIRTSIMQIQIQQDRRTVCVADQIKVAVKHVEWEIVAAYNATALSKRSEFAGIDFAS